ncbi:histidine kinase [Paenibacillus sp. 11B]|uniref:sensor histidine kinase n=1 Tax=Paenibacillus sp. 11B TaxID=3060965 RepID=UPI0026533D7A|nr:histidine kinase [Paenibacillus sp. 11B]MDN8587285.1 histidine kinase [Paenibacillus sp. 11B]
MIKFPAQSWRSSIFARLIVTYLIFVLPLILLGIYLYNWSYDNARQEISSSTERRLVGYLDELNREMEWMELQQFDIVEDRKLNRLAILWEMMDQVDRRDTLHYLSERLATFKNSSVYIKNVHVHIRTIGKSISATHGIDDYNSDSYNYFSSGVQGKGNRFVVKKDEMNLSAVRLSGKKGEAPLFVVQVELDTEQFQNALTQLNLYPDSGSFLMEEQTGHIITDLSQRDFILQAYRDHIIKGDHGAFQVKVDGTRYYVSQSRLESLGLSVAMYLPEKSVKRPLSKFYHWAWLFAMTSFVAITAFLYSGYRLIHIPLLLLVKRFKKMETGVLDIPIVHKQKDEFGFLYSRFNQMLERLQLLIDRDFKKTMMMQRAELKQLQSQINPHFLYNSFFILNSLARTGDTERIEQFTHMLGEYFRFITRNETDQVRLEEEAAHSRIYTEIQKLRFSRRIQADFGDMPAAMERICVPRLIIQPIIENAYEHSLEKMTDQGMLRVRFGIKDNVAEISVEDNGHELEDHHIEALQHSLLEKSDSHEMTGMMNIHRRLVLTYGEKSGLFLTRSELSGLKVTIRIHLEGREDGCIDF